MATFTYLPSYGASVSQVPRTLYVTYGDGYEENSEDGLNIQPKVWGLSFNNISDTTADSIISFFQTNETYITSFDWTDPDGVAGKYMCDKWSKVINGLESFSVSCEFRQVFW